MEKDLQDIQKGLQAMQAMVDAKNRAKYKSQLAAAGTREDNGQSEIAEQQCAPEVGVAGKLYAFTMRTANQLYAYTFGGSDIQPASSETDSAHSQNFASGQTDSGSLSSRDLVKCNACMEVAGPGETLHLQCEHTYCHACLLNLFASAIADTNLFPPRCCKLPIPLDTCRMVLPKELIKEFDFKVEELATPNPTFCANAECSKFIRTGKIVNDVASCVFCKEKTCVLCKSKSHKGLCPSDPHVQLLMNLAKRSKWQQCTNCHTMVELDRGCFHMTCRCKHQFCYLCGVQWKRCLCPQMDEAYLTRLIQQ
jgi:E3 ubiquitin-protein ligase RNF144